MKRGDLSLSTNAIVVLIMALVVLGLAIGFTQGMFSDLRDKLSGYDKEPDAPVASAAEPLRTSKLGDFAVSKGEEVAMKISVYNSFTNSWEYTSADLNCGSSISFKDESFKGITEGTAESMIVVFDAPSSSGTKICTFKVGKADSNGGTIDSTEFHSIEFLMTVG